MAFGIPCYTRLVAQTASQVERNARISALIVAPTRELALQTHETMRKLGELSGLTSSCVYGGVSKSEQIEELKRTEPNVLVGTPGRILDLVDGGFCDLSK